MQPGVLRAGEGGDEHDEYALPNMARSFGYGGRRASRGLEEAAGVVPDPKWKEENIGEPWYRGDAVNMGIGQGFVTATPLQIANAYSDRRRGATQAAAGAEDIGAGRGAEPGLHGRAGGPAAVLPGTLDAIRQGLGLVIHSAGGTSAHSGPGPAWMRPGSRGQPKTSGSGPTMSSSSRTPTAGADGLALAALETGESGSREAAPMVRRILEAYIGGALVSAGP